MESVIIKVPATTANLGPGYDCLGVALQLANWIEVRRVSANGEGANHQPAHPPIVADAARAFFEKANVAPFLFAWSIRGEVPRSRGLGSSVTVRFGILHGLNVLANRHLSPLAIFEICAALEGHPDNAAPAAFGGFTVAAAGKNANGDAKEFARFEVAPELKFVLLIPDFEIATPDARAVLPPTIDRLGAAVSGANACRITAAFATRNYALLRGAFEDHLHQPFRKKLIPFLPEVIANGERAGALGGFLSGSGSTICCIVNKSLESPERVAEAMRAAAFANSLTTIVSADNDGVTIG